MSKRKNDTVHSEYADDWSEYAKRDARKDHKHREERKKRDKEKHGIDRDE